MRDAVGRVLVAAWAVVTVTTIGALMAPHTVALPSPVDLDRVRAALVDLRSGGDVTAHVVPGSCSCTGALLAHLTARGSAGDEVVWMVGPPRPTDGLRAAGYEVRWFDEQTFAATFGIEAGPVLLVLGRGELAYAGGYFRTPAANVPLDLQILGDVRRGLAVTSLPVFGCPLSPALRARLNPLGLGGR